MDKMMNAPVNVEQELTPVSISKSKTELDRKRYLWAISPALPAIGIGILAGYQFAPRPLKKIFALGGPIVLHIAIPFTAPIEMPSKTLSMKDVSLRLDK
jgi:alkane 1-monooxygenase